MATQNKNVLVIGSQGYLGSRLTDYLQALGYKCSGIDTGFFRYGVLHYPADVETKNLDARKISDSDLQGCDAVVMLAGISNDPFGKLSPDAIYDPTREYAIEIAKKCKKYGIRYIFPSSCSVYGIGEGELDEQSEVNPQTPYSKNKLEIEAHLDDLADESFSPIALRFATIFGLSPRIRFDVVINMLCGMALTSNKITLNSNGEAWRPHLYIDDACEAIKCSIEWANDSKKLTILNVGSDINNWRIIDVAKYIQSQIKGLKIEFLGADNSIGNDLIRDRKIQDGVDKRTYRVNFEKIHTVLPGYATKWTVEDGIDRLLSDLKGLQIDALKFNQRDFYRLQQIEYLYEKTKQLDDRLMWIS
jgi:nucleoside-diphosphate-sugar epimerase